MSTELNLAVEEISFPQGFAAVEKLGVYDRLTPSTKKNSKACKRLKHVVAFAVVVCLTFTAGAVGYIFPQVGSSDVQTQPNGDPSYALQLNQSMETTSQLMLNTTNYTIPTTPSRVEDNGKTTENSRKSTHVEHTSMVTESTTKTTTEALKRHDGLSKKALLDVLKEALQIDRNSGNNQMNVAIRNDFLLQDCFNGNLKQSFPDLDYALFGYHLMKGYPWSYGHDPGLTDPIFKADYTDRLQTADCKFSIPAGYIVVPDVSCDISFSSTEIKTKDELLRAVGNSAKASADITGKKFSFGFSASHEFSDMSHTLDAREKIVIVSTATCQSYYAKLKMERPPPFSESFIMWMEKLNNATSKKIGDLEVYLDFIDKYGTHLLKEVKFGARYYLINGTVLVNKFIKEYSMTNTNYKKIKEEQKSTSVGIVANIVSKLNLGLSGSYSRTEREQKIVENFTQRVESRTITIGSAPPATGGAQEWASMVKQTPVPFSYDIEPIETVFDRVFMKPYPHIDAPKIKSNLQYVFTNRLEAIRNRAASWSSTCRVFPNRFDLPEKLCIRGQSDDKGDIEYDRCYQECLDEPGCEATNIYSRTDHEGTRQRSCIFYSSKDTEHNFELKIGPAEEHPYKQHCQSSIYPIKIQLDTKANTNLQKAGKLFLKNLKVSTYGLQHVNCSSNYENSQRCADYCITDTKCVFSVQKKVQTYCCYLGTSDHANSLDMSYSDDSNEYLAFIKTSCSGLY